MVLLLLTFCNVHMKAEGRPISCIKVSARKHGDIENNVLDTTYLASSVNTTQAPSSSGGGDKRQLACQQHQQHKTSIKPLYAFLTPKTCWRMAVRGLVQTIFGKISVIVTLGGGGGGGGG